MLVFILKIWMAKGGGREVICHVNGWVIWQQLFCFLDQLFLISKRHLRTFLLSSVCYFYLVQLQSFILQLQLCDSLLHQVHLIILINDLLLLSFQYFMKVLYCDVENIDLIFQAVHINELIFDLLWGVIDHDLLDFWLSPRAVLKRALTTFDYCVFWLIHNLLLFWA